LLTAFLKLLVVLELLALTSRSSLGRLWTTAALIAILRSDLRQPELRALLAQHSLARQLDAVTLDCQYLHQNLITLTQLVLHFLPAMFCNLRNVKQTVRAWEDLNKRAELCQPDYLAQVRLANLRHGRQVGDHLDRPVQAVSIA